LETGGSELPKFIKSSMERGMIIMGLLYIRK